jgi:peptidoglycan hydrolase-like protein with peptidoglycan-binding domain
VALFDTTFAPYFPFGSRTLSSGSRGTDVAVVQAVYDLMLNTMNPPQGPMGSPIAIDGTFGAHTTTAVKSIQSYFGLVADGVVGPNTYFLFGQGVGPHETYGGPVYGSRQLQVGNSGGDVTILQNRLNLFRYATIIGGPATGTFNTATAGAVTAFKQDAEANGDTGFPNNAIAGYGFYDATWIYTFAGGRAIETGRNGFDVVFVQVILQGLGFYAGRITGYYDTATRSAVMNFQASAGISVDGVVGPVTFYQLGLRNLHPAPAPLGIAWPPTPPPPPSVTVCSSALTSTTGNLHPFGSATLTINQLEGFQALNVAINTVPPPPPPYTAYLFTLTDPATGNVVATQVMTQLSNEQDWAGILNVGVATIPSGIVTVYPSTASGSRHGPAILMGDLSTCH